MIYIYMKERKNKGREERIEEIKKDIINKKRGIERKRKRKDVGTLKKGGGEG